MFLASLLVPVNDYWEAWWIDTKNDPKDIAAVQEWGFELARNNTRSALWHRKTGNKKLFVVTGDPYNQCEQIFEKAYHQRGVLVIVDEYVQVVKSSANTGPALKDIFQRGGGLDVGIIGMTQEPVYIPRQLFSQATHQFLFSVTYPYDISYFQTLYEDYESPISRGDDKGFYHVAVDLDGKAAYYKHQRDWFEKTLERGRSD